MKDFNFYAPTEVVFGEQSEEQGAALLKNPEDMEKIYQMARR